MMARNGIKKNSLIKYEQKGYKVLANAQIDVPVNFYENKTNVCIFTQLRGL